MDVICWFINLVVIVIKHLSQEFLISNQYFNEMELEKSGFHLPGSVAGGRHLGRHELISANMAIRRLVHKPGIA